MRDFRRGCRGCERGFHRSIHRAIHFVIQQGLGAWFLALLLPLAASGENAVELVVERSGNSSTPFEFEINLELDLMGVTGITASSPMMVYPLVFEADSWRVRDNFTSLDAAKTALDGTWTITITGASPSTSTFQFSAALLQDSDFYPTPTVLNPTEGATGVANDVTFSWTDPTGPATPYIVVVEVDDVSSDQDDDSLFGTLNIDETTWMPPLALVDGPADFLVFYGDVDPSFVTPLMVTSGSIVWSKSGFAPPAYPDTTPLFAATSKSTVLFTVPEPGPPLAQAAVLAGLAVLGRGRKRRARDA